MTKEVHEQEAVYADSVINRVIGNLTRALSPSIVGALRDVYLRAFNAGREVGFGEGIAEARAIVSRTFPVRPKRKGAKGVRK